MRPKIIAGGRSIYFAHNFAWIGKSGANPIDVLILHQILPESVNLVTLLQKYIGTLQKILPESVNLVIIIYIPYARKNKPLPNINLSQI